MLKFLSLVLAASAVSISAAQADTSHWQGSYVGLGLGSGDVHDPHVEYLTGTRTPNGFEGLNADQSPLLSLTVGHDWLVNSVVLGLETRLQRRSFEDRVDQTLFGEPAPGFASEYHSDSSLQLLARIGRLIDETALIYGTLGLVETRYTRVYEAVTVGVDRFEGTEAGRLIGFGYERVIDADWSLRGEVSRTWYEEETHTPVNSWSDLDEVHKATETNVTVFLIRHF